MKKVLIIITLFYINLSISALFRSPEAGRYYYWLYSPELLSRSMGVIGTMDPSGFVINPAAVAFVQRFKIDFSYGVAPGFLSEIYNSGDKQFGAGDFFWPFIINAGFIIPSKFGNFSVYTNYLNMSNFGFNFTNNNDLGIGKIGSLYFGYSKDYSDKIAFGINANLKIMYNPLLKEDLDKPENEFDVSGGIDLGFIYKPEIFKPFSKKRTTAWGFQDFELAITIKDLGKPFIYFPKKNADDLPWFINPFTPAVGIGFNLFNDGSTYWKILTDLTSPFFQNVTLALGTEIQIYKFIVLRGSYTFDLEGVLEYAGVLPKYGFVYNLANVGFGLSFRFTSDFANRTNKKETLMNKHKATSFSIDIGGRPYHQGFIFQLGCTLTIGVRDETPPEITFIQNDIYSSPNLDGIQDEIVIDLEIKDERYVIYWKFEIYNENNNVIRKIESKEKRKEGMKAKDVLKKFFSPKSGIPIPKKIIWDGRDDGGSLVSDGTYFFKFFAMDDNKNMDKDGSASGKIIIDTEQPEVKSKITNNIFSPNNDGSKDKLIIDIEIIKDKVESKKEEILIHNKPTIREVPIPQIIKNKADPITEKKQNWYVDILDNSGSIVRRFEYSDKGKKKIEWDGKDENGNKVQDGVYKVKIHSIDNAGNYWEELVSNIIIDTEPTPIEARVLNNIFSPNGDGNNDEVEFLFSVPVVRGIDKWKLEIFNKKDQIIKTFSNNGVPEISMKWNGLNEDHETAIEDQYYAKFTVIYKNGNTPNITTPSFSIDVTSPTGNVIIKKEIFSPNGDSKNDDLTISNATSTEEEWRGIIYDQDNKKVRTYSWKDNAPNTLIWDGKDNNNNLLKDGKYYYLISCEDEAGNSFISDRNEISIFTKDTPVFVYSKHKSFSPNNDGVKDEQILEINATISDENKVSNWNLDIIDDSDKLFFTINDRGDLPKNIKWFGLNNKKENCDDGYYYAVLNVNFESGTSSKSRSSLFSIDTIIPEIDITANSSVFSPNNDSFLDEIEILQKGSSEKLWQSIIVNKNNKIVWKNSYKGNPLKKEIWNGKDMNGNSLKNGYYKYTIKCMDEAGNYNEKRLNNIEIKNIHTSIFLTLENDMFSPNNDSVIDTIKLKTFLSVKNDVDVYKVEILNNKNKVIKTFFGKENIPNIINWDGKDANGNIADDGIYKANFSAIYKFGNRPVIRSANFILDTTPPKVEIQTEPKYFSPDNDGNNDALSLFINSDDLSGIKNWQISIIDPFTDNLFYSFKGEEKPTNKIRWNGKNRKGQIVESAEDYPLRIYALDKVGNILDKEIDPIMIDILIVKLNDDRLKIKISNIEFKPDSHLMTNSPKNKKILDLIAKALKKYRQYKITVEGHANRFKKGLNESKAKMLSEKRAKTVSYELNKRGINIKRMTIIGKGFEVPIVNLDQDSKKEELAKNRRVEFYLDKN